MPRWTRERDFDLLVKAGVQSFAWPFPEAQALAAVKALIGTESAFKPEATRGEPQIGDASIGLMQLLVSTARDLGYPGLAGDKATLSGLYTPSTNIYLGAKLLHRLLGQTRGDLDAAVSAYNGGYRPTYGFGAPRTPGTPTVCLRWKATAPRAGRTIERDCAELGSTQAGTFSNQRYVDRFRSNYAYFFEAGRPGRPSPPSSGGPPPGASS